MNYDSKLYKYNDLFKAPELPGLYGWYVRLPKVEAVADYHKIHKSKRMRTTIVGHLSEIYEGNAYSKEYEFRDSMDFELLEAATSCFCPPIYIGVSNNMRSRLQTHCEQIEEIIHSGKKTTEPRQVDPDTDAESTLFGDRIGIVLSSVKNIGLTSLFVITIAVKTNFPRAELFKIESFLNRTYIPIYGRK